MGAMGAMDLGPAGGARGAVARDGRAGAGRADAGGARGPRARAVLRQIEQWRRVPAGADAATGVESADLFVPEETPDELRPREGGPRIRVRVFRPPREGRRPAAPRVPVVIFVHGGEFVRGSAAAREYHTMCCQLAAGGFVVAAPEYRRGPDAPFPAAVEDVYRALAWVVDGGEMPPEADCGRIILMGDSNGGGLVAVLSSLARDRLTGTLEDCTIVGEFSILHQVIVNGWFFMNEPLWEAREPSLARARREIGPRVRDEGRAAKRPARDDDQKSPALPGTRGTRGTPGTQPEGAASFVPGGASVGHTLDVYLPLRVRKDALEDRRCSPWLAGLHDLPATTVVASSESPFWEENLRYCERASAMGNKVVQHVVDDVHAFITVFLSPNRQTIMESIVRELVQKYVLLSNDKQHRRLRS